MDKKYIQFSGMCRTSFLVILEYLNKKYPNKELIICSYNLKKWLISQDYLILILN